MNIENKTVKTFKTPISVNSQQSVEQEFILPDYYGDISKILKCSLVPSYDNVSVSGDKISISGTCRLLLVYYGEDKKLYSYSNDIAYTKMMQCSGIEAGDCVSVNVKLLSENCRALGPKRIEVRSMVYLNALVYGVKAVNIISDITDNNIEIRSTSDYMFIPSCCVQRDFALEETAELSIKGNTCEIIHTDDRLIISELKSIDNKVYMKGELFIEVIYLDDEGDTGKRSFSLPVSEVVDAYEACEDDICCLTDVYTVVNTAIKDSASNEKSISLTAKISFVLVSGKQSELSCISDLYSTGDGINTVFEEVEFRKEMKINEKTFVVNYETDVFEEDIAAIGDSFIENLQITTEKKENGFVLVVNANCNALLNLSDGMHSFITRTCNEEYVPEINKNVENLLITDAKVLSVMAIRQADNKIKFTFDVCVKYHEIVKCKVKALSKISPCEAESFAKEKGIILYYAKKNESLWEIGKENRASQSFIRSINGIEEDILTEDRVLVFPEL